MGRQLPLATTGDDVVHLLAAIDRLEPIRVFRSSASHVDFIEVAWQGKQTIEEDFLSVWPVAFAWSPILKQTGGPRCPVESRGQFYIANLSTAPVIELSRYPGTGRIYWARDFSAPNGLDYDEQAFAKLVDKIWRWIRKNARKSDSKDSPYYMPGAWKELNNL